MLAAKRQRNASAARRRVIRLALASGPCRSGRACAAAAAAAAAAALAPHKLGAGGNSL